MTPADFPEANTVVGPPAGLTEEVKVHVANLTPEDARFLQGIIDLLTDAKKEHAMERIRQMESALVYLRATGDPEPVYALPFLDVGNQ